MICNACPRGCNVDRQNTLGYCKSPEKFKLARASLHYWEEPCISGKNGSGAIFFSGCNLGCVFCQNYEISHGCKGVEVSDDKLIDIMKRLVDEGANNINFVNPTHYSLQLLRVLEKYKPPVPIVYNFFVPAPMAISAVALDEAERTFSAILLDMGGGTTTATVIRDSQIKYATVDLKGASDITHDISVVLSTTMSDAEALKRDYGYALLNKPGLVFFQFQFL